MNVSINDLVIDNTAKWLPTGLLDGLDVIRARELALIMSDAADMLSNIARPFEQYDPVSVIFPVLRRLYERGYKNYFDIWHKLSEYYKSVNFDVHTYNTLDIEAEMVLIFCEQYKEDLCTPYMKQIKLK